MNITYTLHTFEDQTCICKWVDGIHAAAFTEDPANTDYQEFLSSGAKATPYVETEL